MNDRILRARRCQEDIRRCEGGAPSKIIINRFFGPTSIMGDGLKNLLDYRAFPIAESVAYQYEDILRQSKARMVFDIGSGLGTSVLSACIVAEENAASIERVYSIETSEQKRNWMRQYLEYCGESELVASIGQEDFIYG